VLIARGLSATIGVTTVGLVFLAARRLYGAGSAVAAAGLLAVVPLHVTHVLYANVDVLLTAWFAAVLLPAYAIACHGSAGAAALGGAVVGAAFATKQPGMALLVPVGWAVGEHAWRTRSPRRAVLLAGVVGTAAVVTAVLCCPPCAWRWQELLHWMARHRELNMSRTFANASLSASLGWYARPWVYQLVASLPFALGWPLYLLALAGVVQAVRSRTLADRLLLGTLLPYFAVIASGRTVAPRFLLPLCPGLVILAARVAVEGPGARRLRTAVVAGVWLYALVLAGSLVARASGRPRWEIAGWIAGTRGPELHRPVRVGLPAKNALTEAHFRLRPAVVAHGLTYMPLREGGWFDADADVIVFPDLYATEIRRDRPESQTAKDLDRLESGAAGFHGAAHWQTWYLQRGFYAWLDPAFGPNLFDFVVYVRDAPGP
jgi:4-amino-4-deoxy-L-arabinose transferase-like glycosyltransferase